MNVVAFDEYQLEMQEETTFTNLQDLEEMILDSII